MQSSPTGIHTPVDRFFEFSLLGLLASGYLAVVGSGLLDLPTSVLTAAALLLRALFVSGIVDYAIPPKLVAAATIGYMGFYPIDFEWVSRSFVPATVHLVFFIAIVKILTATTNRDYFFVKLIAFMELLAACVLSSSVHFFLFLSLFLLLGVATFASSEIRQSAQKAVAGRSLPRRPVAFRLAAVTVFVSAGILVLTGALFFLLPRTARAAFQHLLSHRYHIAGFSNEVSLGAIGEIKRQDTPVMHVKFDPAHERPPLLRWRGTALAHFDGHRWFNRDWRGDQLRPSPNGLTLSGYRDAKGLSYAVHMNDIRLDGVLFFAGTPQSLQIDVPLILRTPVDSYRVISGGADGLNYSAYSYLEPPPGWKPRDREALPDVLPSDARKLYLSLPPVDARIFSLTQAITAGEPAPEAQARAIENYLRTTYQYTLELPKVEAADPLANFLFNRRKGHCEYFASAMAVMLRTSGIPSRVVTGFFGGIYNPISGWQVIRASDAHSWVEAYIPRRGWTTFDPTPPDPNPPGVSLWTRLGFYVDAADVFWQDWVIGYNLDRQLLLASRMERSGRNFRMGWLDDLGGSAGAWKSSAVATAALYSACIVPAFVVLFLTIRFRGDVLRWWRNRRRLRHAQRGVVHRTDATLLYERMLRQLKRHGIEKPAWLTPWEFAQAVSDPALAILVEDITSAYNELRFGGSTEAGARMIELLGRLPDLPVRRA